MIDVLTSIILLILYVLLNLFLSFKVYNFQKKFYVSNKTNTLPNNGTNISKDIEYENINIHDNYPEFRRYDELTFLRIFFGMLFLFWIRFSLIICLNFVMFILVKILFWNENSKITLMQIKVLRIINKIIMGGAFLVLGIFIDENRLIDNEVYSKYLGPGIYENFEKDYSLIVSNHISWVEILYYMKRYSAGFISKASVKDFIMIGLIAQKIDCLFLDRTNKEERDNVAERIKERQESFLRKEAHTPLLIFPEGTVTSGKHILKFKRGAFQNMLPIKPVFIKDHNEKSTLSVGVTKFLYHFVISLCYIYHKVEVIELPIITPTEFMLENYSHLGKSKWEIYSEVVRNIYCELGNFQKSDRQFRDTLNYLSVIYGREIKNT